MVRIKHFLIFHSLFLLCISEVFALPPYKPYDIFFENDKGMMTYKDNYLMIYCSKTDTLMTDAFQSINETYITGVSVNRCSLENTTFIDEFDALNINTTTIESLHYSSPLEQSLAPGNYTEGLNIKRMSINIENNRHIFENTQNFLDPLSNLKDLYAAGVVMPPIPTNVDLVNLTLSNAGIKGWGSCEYIESFYLSNSNEEDIPKWPENCKRLKYLTMKYMLPETTLMIAKRMVAAGPSLHSLKITYCKLHSLPVELLKSAQNLVHLDLSDNALYDEKLPPFPHLGSLKTLDLSLNLIRGYYLGDLILKLPALSKFVLTNGDDLIGDEAGCVDGSSFRNGFIVPLQNSSIETLVLSYSNVHMNCFRDIRFLNLKYLFLDHPPDSEILELLQLPNSDAGRLEIDFGYTPVDEILFNETHYDSLRRENSSKSVNGRNQTVLLKYVTCDCTHGWLARALRDFPNIISMPALKCDNEYGVDILEEPPQHMECNRTEPDDGCVYRKSWSDGRVTADCEVTNLTKIDFMYPLHGLNVSDQGITTLPSQWPDNLQWVDLRRNRLSRATTKEAKALFAAGRRVWLSDNLLLCECDNSALLDAIQQHRDQVLDYDLLICVGSGEALSLISTDVLCQVAMFVSLTVLGTLILIAGLIALLLRRYGEQLRMFLYSRGYCVRLLQRKDLDDKPYDAFLSYAHDDQEYVEKTLLPGLENAPEQFRVCVHYRDWPIGDWIPAQIMRSVQLSKRTLILLSKNFADSPWSNLELKYALANAAEDSSSRVIVLVKDDVLDTKLDAELRGYLTMNTYLSCDDPWFWEKLRYAMPHRFKQNSDQEITSTLGSGNNLMTDANIEEPITDSIENCREVGV